MAAYYRSALCVLNDHWPTMASLGIISNRLYDVTAAGGVAISDDVEGIEEMFPGHVRVYRTSAELIDLAKTISDWAPPLHRRRELSREILRLHSFDARAKQFIDVVWSL